MISNQKTKRIKNNNLSIVTVSMNRTNHLYRTAKRISDCSYHAEHIIIDWSSAPPVNISDLPKDKRIKLYRVSEEKKWHLTRAYNFGFQMVKNKYILKADADVLIDEEFFQKNRWEIDAFLANDPRAGSLFIKSLTGLFFVPRSRIVDVGGFNEYLEGWGYDDIDLFARLRKFCEYKQINLDNVEAISQDDRERIKYTNDVVKLAKGNIEINAIKKANAEKNKWLSFILKWDKIIPRSSYKKREEGDWVARFIPKIPNYLVSEIDYIKRKAFVEHMLGIKIGFCSREDVRRLEFLAQTKYRFITKTIEILLRIPNKIIRIVTIKIARIKYK
jgi:hypothetical protein